MNARFYGKQVDSLPEWAAARKFLRDKLAAIPNVEVHQDAAGNLWATLRGKRVYVFSFNVGKDKGYSMYHGESKREYVSAYKGLVYADRDTKAVMRIKMECVGIPPDYPIHEVGLTLDYNPTKIAEQEFTVDLQVRRYVQLYEDVLAG